MNRQKNILALDNLWTHSGASPYSPEITLPEQEVTLAKTKLAKPAFTLIEVMVAIAIIVMMSSLILPQFLKINPTRERNAILNNLNALVALARNNAITTQKLHRIVFDLDRELVVTEVALSAKKDDGATAFIVPQQLGSFRSLKFPKHLVIQHFIIEGMDAMSRSSDRTTNRIWFYIMPNGRAQNVIINVVDMHEMTRGTPKSIGLTLNPFSVSFEAYEN